jgi:hypothetical protein
MSGIIAQNSGRHTGLVKASSVTSSDAVWNLILTQTASASATIDFTSDIDDTYDEYVFKFIDIHPSADGENLTFNGNAAGGSGYNETITSSYFRSTNAEDDSAAALAYQASLDLAQSTNFQPITNGVGSDNDQSMSGYLQLFNPSDTTYVTHFMSRTSNAHASNLMRDVYTGGYFNTTSAIDEIQFKMSSGNIDAGTISLYGIS